MRKDRVQQLAATIGTVLAVLVFTGHSFSQDDLNRQQIAQLSSLNDAVPPDSDIQNRLRELFRLASKESEEQAFRIQTREFERFEKESYAHLIPQLLYWKVYVSIVGGDVMEAMFPGVVIDMLEIQDTQIARALAPYLDTGNARVDHAVRGMLGGFETFALAIQTRLGRGEELPRETIKYLYSLDPGRTVIMIQDTIGRTDPNEWRPVLWAEHQVSDILWQWRYGFLPKNQVTPEAKEALRRLADHPRWWARLYVAEVMRQYPPFRSDDLIDLLRDDEDETVRATIREIPGEGNSDDE